PHGRAAGPDEHVHPLVEDVVGPLEADLELAQPDLLDALELVFGRRHRLEVVELLLERGDTAHDALPFVVARVRDSRIPRPYLSMEYRIPGGTTTVVSGASTTPCPSTTVPGGNEPAP